MSKTPTIKYQRSRAKTAYGLLSEIRRLILAAPLRYDQRNVLSFIGERDALYRPQKFPDCGTVGCVGGWIAALKATQPERLRHVMRFAARLLRLSNDQQNELFTASAVDGQSQTREHAKNGAKHIEQFQEKYRDQLTHTRIPTSRVNESLRRRGKS